MFVSSNVPCFAVAATLSFIYQIDNVRSAFVVVPIPAKLKTLLKISFVPSISRSVRTSGGSGHNFINPSWQFSGLQLPLFVSDAVKLQT